MIHDTERDITKLRYVLYARKSTVDSESQVRSLPDQIKECKQTASRLGIHIVATLTESRSAKRPNQRPIFSQMLKDLKAKKYDAILTWHPDRLCRNMLEGGQVIHMLDEGEIQDIRFHTHHFTNDPNGKMLLGMLLVFSKQYSDDLSIKVSRGVGGNFSEGKSSGSPKWGFDRCEREGVYRPNESFDLVKEAWLKRANGETNYSICQFLLDNGYHRKTKMSKKNKRTRKILPTEKTVGVMFGDPFYYGILIQANQTIDLREIYNFEPMISEDTFNQVQSLGYVRRRDVSSKKRTEFKPLMHMVYCAVCNDSKWMVAGKNLPGGSKQHVLSYCCKNKSCTRHTKSVRARYVFDAIYRQLECIELTEGSYERYSRRIDNFTGDKIIAIKQEVSSKRGILSHTKRQLEELSLGLSKIEKSSPAYEINERRITELALDRDELEGAIGMLEDKIANPNKIKLTKIQFLNLTKTAPDKMRAGSAVEKDRLARIFFLNLRINDEYELNCTWNEPFASLVKALEIPSGADERT